MSDSIGDVNTDNLSMDINVANNSAAATNQGAGVTTVDGYNFTTPTNAAGVADDQLAAIDDQAYAGDLQKDINAATNEMQNNPGKYGTVANIEKLDDWKNIEYGASVSAQGFSEAANNGSNYIAQQQANANSTPAAAATSAAPASSTDNTTYNSAYTVPASSSTPAATSTPTVGSDGLATVASSEPTTSTGVASGAVAAGTAASTAAASGTSTTTVDGLPTSINLGTPTAGSSSVLPTGTTVGGGSTAESGGLGAAATNTGSDAASAAGKSGTESFSTTGGIVVPLGSLNSSNSTETTSSGIISSSQLSSAPTIKADIAQAPTAATDEPTASAQQPTATAGGTTVSVVAGDTLTTIAAKNGVSLKELESYNPKITNPDLIFPGEPVTIPPHAASAAVVGGGSSANPTSTDPASSVVAGTQTGGANAANSANGDSSSPENTATKLSKLKAFTNPFSGRKSS